MSWTDFFTSVKRYDDNATVIFDHAEPIGQPTDLVMPRKSWFGCRLWKKLSPARPAAPGRPRS